MNTASNDYQINTTKNYYSYFFIVTIISASAIALIQISRPSLVLSIVFFLLIESYFFFRKQIVSLLIHEGEITIIYFQFLKKITLSSNLKKVKITTESQISYGSSIKKFTLLIKIKEKKFLLIYLMGLMRKN